MEAHPAQGISVDVLARDLGIPLPFGHRQTGTGWAIGLLAQIRPPCLVRQVGFKAGAGIRDQIISIKLPHPDRIVLVHGDEALAVGRELKGLHLGQADNCATCHGENAKGNRELGSANLTDKIWLYGSDKETIVQTLTNGRGGVMPAWGKRLDEPTLKSLVVYVWSFGGGEK